MWFKSFGTSLSLHKYPQIPHIFPSVHDFCKLSFMKVSGRVRKKWWARCWTCSCPHFESSAV